MPFVTTTTITFPSALQPPETQNCNLTGVVVSGRQELARGSNLSLYPDSLKCQWMNNDEDYIASLLIQVLPQWIFYYRHPPRDKTTSSNFSPATDLHNN